MKPEPGDTVGCVNCHEDFELPHPAHDAIYIPSCPRCGAVVDGYEDAVKHRERNAKAREACRTILQKLERICDDTQSTLNRTEEGTALLALREATEDLHSLSELAMHRTEEIVDDDR